MKVRLFSGNVCVASKDLVTDEDYARIGHAPVLFYKNNYFYFTGVFDQAVNFQQGEEPAEAIGFREH
jgi:hypothetical protein